MITCRKTPYTKELFNLTSLPFSVRGRSQGTMKGLNMKKLLFCTVALTGLLAASLKAGPAVEYKQVAPPPPPLYGVGFYGAIDMGANIYQNRGDNQTFTDDGVGVSTPDFGDTLTFNP